MTGDQPVPSVERCVILIFSKIPRPQWVKTRLINEVLDANDVMLLHEGFLLDTIRSILMLGDCDIIFSLADNAPLQAASLYEIPFFRDMVDLNHPNIITQFHDQVEGTFGERMRSAIEWVRSRYSYSRIIILGADSPQLQPQVLEQTRNLLSYYEAVLGPSAAGGIYLIALRENVPLKGFEGVFSQVELIQLSHYLRKNDISYFLLEELTDIDTEEDLIGLISWITSAKLSGNREMFIPEETETRLRQLNLKIAGDMGNNRQKRLIRD